MENSGKSFRSNNFHRNPMAALVIIRFVFHVTIHRHTQVEFLPCHCLVLVKIDKETFLRSLWFFNSQHFLCLHRDAMIKVQDDTRKCVHKMRRAPNFHQTTTSIKSDAKYSWVLLNFIVVHKICIYKHLQPSSFGLSPLKLLSTMKCCFYDCDVKRRKR